MIKSKKYWNKQAILESLWSNEWASSNELSRWNNLSISEVRSAVCALRKEGYEIDGIPFQGYSLNRAPAKLAEGLVRRLINNETIRSEVILFHSIEDADSYLLLHAFHLPNGAAMLVSPEDGEENIHPEKLFKAPVHVSILFQKKLLDEEATLHSFADQIAVLAEELLVETFKHEPIDFHIICKRNQIYINNCIVGSVSLHSLQTKQYIVHIQLNLNCFLDKTYISRHRQAAMIINAITGSGVSQ